jgi:hypothetical protein
VPLTAPPAPAITTLIFLSFDKPIKYEEIFLKSDAGIPNWETTQKDERIAVVWIHGQVKSANLSIEIIR